MARRSEQSSEELRARILGLSESSFHKSYYPQLQSSMADLRMLFDSVNDGIFVHDAETGYVIDINRRVCEMYGFSREEILDLSVERMSSGEPPYTLEDAQLWIKKALSGRPQLFEWHARKKNGELFWVEVSMSLVTGGGKPRILAVVRDVTERREMEARLHQFEKMDAIGQLAGGVAHDVNNQLGAIVGYADMLLDGLTDPSMREYVEGIMLASQRSADLVKNLLTFSRKGPFRSEPVNLNYLVREVVTVLSRTIDKRIAIETHLDADDLMMTGDSSLLQNAILNIGLNARDAMPNGGSLLFKTSKVFRDNDGRGRVFGELPPGDYLCLEIQDTGGGMDQEVLRHIFEPFFTTKEIGKGTGMGLAAVYGTVKRHRGAINVYSEVGRGTVFRIYFPSYSFPHQIKSDEVSLPSLEKMKFLVIDDESIMLDVIGRILKKNGHDVVSADSGGKGVDIYREKWREIDMVVSDMMMPGMPIRQMLDEMRKVNPEVKVMLMSGFCLGDDMQDVLVAGSVGFIMKPFNKDKLLSKLDEFVRSWRDGALRPAN